MNPGSEEDVGLQASTEPGEQRGFAGAAAAEEAGGERGTLRRLLAGFARPRVAVSIQPGDVRLLVARANGGLRAIHHSVADFPEAFVRPSLRPPNLTDAAAVSATLEELVAAARKAGALRRKPGLVALLVPDATVRVAVVPMQGTVPGRAQGDSMAWWALRDLLPMDLAAARIDWSYFSGVGGAGWLLAVAAEAAVIREYEMVIESIGWTVGRVAPWTMAVAVGSGVSRPASFSMSPEAASVPAGAEGRLDDAEASGGVEPSSSEAGEQIDELVGGQTEARARLVLSEIGDRLAYLVEANGVPRFHRAGRGRVDTSRLVDELRTVQQYVRTRLKLAVSTALLSGSPEWVESASLVCQRMGWRVETASPWGALIGVVAG